jgi:molybdopterin synthase catalytic subunit/molybdopterin converting factor small subunit
VRVVVKLFGAVREAVGEKELSVALPVGARVWDLLALLARDHPIVERFGERLATSVNLEVVPGETLLADGDEVALLPPVAGGAGRCWLSDRPLDSAAVSARVEGPGMGGIVVFVGAVRDRARGREIRHLEYEAYPGMAEREMERIADEAAGRWQGARVAIAHRTGRLEIGDVAVVVAAAAPHRAEAFAACRYAIDTLKERVPIWKKEFATDGEYWVEEHP